MPYGTTSIDLRGTYSWQLLFDIDNSSNDGEIRRTETVKSSLSVNRSSLVQEIQNYVTENRFGTSSEIGVGAKITLVDINVKSGMTNDFSMKAVKELKTTTEQAVSKTVEETTTTEITVGKRSRLRLYRLVFNGPGMHYATPTLSSEPHKIEDVILSCSVQTIKVLKDIRIVYTDDAISKPDDSLEEVDGYNTDINAGFGGSYVWLVPVWTSNQDEGVTSIQVVIQGTENPSYSDMAKGAGGDYRYLKMIRDKNSASRITKVRLWRTAHEDSKPSRQGWHSWTGDINANRKKDYVYICWENTTV